MGIDVIGQHLTEINVTSPTGLQELERFEKRIMRKQFGKVLKKMEERAIDKRPHL